MSDDDETPRRTLPVDWDSFIWALTSDPMMEWYLDLQTGQVLMRGDDLDEVSDAFEDDLERYEQILPLGSREKWRWREDFALEQPAEQARERLLEALRGSGAFRRFDDAVRDEDLGGAWQRFEERCLRRATLDWLAEHGIDPAPGPGDA